MGWKVIHADGVGEFLAQHQRRRGERSAEAATGRVAKVRRIVAHSKKHI